MPSCRHQEASVHIVNRRCLDGGRFSRCERGWCFYPTKGLWRISSHKGSGRANRPRRERGGWYGCRGPQAMRYDRVSTIINSSTNDCWIGWSRERDKQLIWRVAKIYEDGQQNVQIGDNTNLVDYLYVGNAAHAHVLAADCLLEKPETVSGQVFFITNGEPIPQWDFNRLIFKELGDDGSKKIFTIPRALALFLAMVTEFVCRITGKESEFNRYNIRFITGVQWYNIDKVPCLC